MRSVEIHQALHGYSDGHKLLQASRRFSQDAQRWMLILSDLSGPNIPSKLESYLTGYPLPAGDAYVFAKTWIAREAKRPGSVWTHSLIVEAADLAQLRELKTLQRLFRRPTATRLNESYGQPLEFDIDPLASVSGDSDLEHLPVRDALAQEVIRSLYGDSSMPVVVEAPPIADFTEFVLAIWQQQWPRLRRSFRFCTTSLALRTIDGTPFDLQIMPPDRLRGRVLNAIIVRSDDFATGLPLAHDPWVINVLKDLSEPDGGDLRAFLWRFGADVRGGREAFRHLVCIFSMLGEAQSPTIPALSELLRFIGDAFQDHSDALTLKLAIFGSEHQRASSRIVRTADAVVLETLALAEQWTGLAVHDLALRQRAEVLWRTDPNAARNLLEVLLSQDPNELGVEILEGLCDAVPLQAALSIIAHRPEVLSTLVRRNPSLASASVLWQRSINEQRDLLDALSEIQVVHPEETVAALKAMVVFADDSIADVAVRKFGVVAIDATLSRIADDPNHILSPNWRRALTARPIDLMQWLKDHPTAPFRTVRLIVQMLDPDSENVRTFGAEPWLHVLRSGSCTPDAEFAGFLLSLGMSNISGGSEDLVVASFQTVHTAQEMGALSYEAWARLRPRLPELPWWKDWDRCERLRRGLVDCFVSYDWPVKKLMMAVSDHRTFDRVLDYCELSSKGRHLLALLEEEVNRAPNEFPWQQTIIRRHL